MTETIKEIEINNIDDDKLSIIKLVDKLAKEKYVEKIVYQINRNEKPENLSDLILDIYVLLLTKNIKKTLDLYNKNLLNYFISRIVMNNICSKTSQYHRIYRNKYTITNFDSLSNKDLNLLGQDTEWTKI